MTLPISTVGYLIRGDRGSEEILMGTKAPTPKAISRKIAGKLLSYGGDFEPAKDKTPYECFQRELLEETSIIDEHTGKIIEPGFSVALCDLEAMARIRIYGPEGFRLILYYFLSWNWNGSPKKQSDIINPKWYPARPLPDDILETDKLVLPLIIDGIRVAGSMTYDANMNVIAKWLNEVEGIE